MRNTKKTIFLPLCLCALLTACTSTPSNPRDPLEPLNRVTYKFNDKADRWVLKPVATAYRDYAPQPIQTGIRNFFNNIEDVFSAINFGLQGEGKPALYNFGRFALNTTVGLFGFLDVTTGHERAYGQTGFGLTYARWGWKNSSYLVIPFYGPSTIRDGTGFLTTVVLTDNTYSNEKVTYALLLARAVNTRAKYLGLETTINSAALDPYIYTRDAWLQMRAKQAGDTTGLPAEEDINIDDLVKSN